MAHCVHSSKREIALMKRQGVFIAHCPQSNTNIASGIAPVRTYLDEGLRIGLGSDVAGGSSENMCRAVADAIQVSKLRWRLKDQSLRPLTLAEGFYLATEGGGAYFGKVGSFKEGYEMDAVIMFTDMAVSVGPMILYGNIMRFFSVFDPFSSIPLPPVKSVLISSRLVRRGSIIILHFAAYFNSLW